MVTLPYPGLLGFREVAGLRVVGGGRVRSGVLYRSGTPQFLDEATARRMLAETGIATTLDLRLPHEIAQEGRGPLDTLGVRHLRHAVRVGTPVSATSAVAPMAGDDPLVATYLRYLDMGPDAVVGAVADLSRRDAAPVLVHCTVGKDRTGVIVAMVLDAIGVARDDIVAEYGLRPEDVRVSMERLRTMVSYGDAVDLYPPEAVEVDSDTIRRFLDAVDARHGGTRAFLLAGGVTVEQLADLEELLVDRAVT